MPLFQDLTREQQLEVAQVARSTTMVAGQSVDIGDDDPRLVVVHTGRLKVAHVTHDGTERLLRVLGPGDFTGESAFLTGRASDHVATALEDGSMCVFRHGSLTSFVAAHPSIALRMLQGLSRRLATLERRLAALLADDVSARLAGYLLELPAEPAEHGLAVRLPLAKKDVASLLDTTPESLSRQLRRLNDSGITAAGDGQRLTILDVDALVELATGP